MNQHKQILNATSLWESKNVDESFQQFDNFERKKYFKTKLLLPPSTQLKLY